ncbi:MAG: glycosyltransferase [Chitinophagaceae bacterium]|nr:glycosyltransferase [Chitinophagaceae bacterium]
MVLFISILFFLFVVYAILIDYYRRAWNKLPLYITDDIEPQTIISVVIAMRNEEENVKQLLNSLEKQTYPKNKFQVVIVDDHSEDKTWELLSSHNYSFLWYIAMKLADHYPGSNQNMAHKKRALEVGINASEGKLIVTTDADCTFPENWLSTIARFYETTGAKFIAAPVRIETNRTLISVFQTTDFLTLQGITGASVYKRMHTMCNGANLAYEKAAFIEVNGFSGIDDLPSGDDMLLMYKIYKRYPENVHYLKATSAIVNTSPVRTWRQFFHQRIRWASKADRYDDKRIFRVLLLVYLLNVGFLALGVAAFFKPTYGFFLLLFLLAKVLIEFPFVNSVAAFFGQQRLVRFFLLLQPLHIFYTIIAGWLGKFGSFEWKGRTIKKVNFKR